MSGGQAQGSFSGITFRLVKCTRILLLFILFLNLYVLVDSFKEGKHVHMTRQ